MLLDFINIDKNSKTPLYNQIYLEIKQAIENGSIKENEKLTSVRGLSADLGVSKTTVETAYNALCSEGYIINAPKKGYFVEKGIYIERNNEKKAENIKAVKQLFKYDFSGKGIDKSISNIKEWRKYVKDILNKEYLLNTYSENQGEEELRKAIAKYAFSSRGVKAGSESIIIGSGSQTLIYILCGLLGLDKTVEMEKNSFPQAEQVFRDFRYDIKYSESDKKGITTDSLKKNNPDLILINPNSDSPAMPVTRKIEIINYAKENNILIIEDDYNGELRYKTHPSASLQSIARDNTVYIGSFSKILLPSVRISYMILPDRLISKYIKIKDNYNQTTSKIEQLALSSYISNGKLEKHLRKLRRYYSAKSDMMKNCLKNYNIPYKFNETLMFFEIEGNKDRLINSGINVMRGSGEKTIRLNFSQINSDLIESGIKEIAKILKNS